MNCADMLEKTYQDKCDIYRYEEIVQDGITRTEEVLKLKGVKCALSQGSLSKITGENVAEVTTTSKAFFRPEVDVQEGDKLIITQKGSSRPKSFIAGEAFTYDESHTEVKLSRSDKA